MPTTTDTKRATITDWVWLQGMLMQAMVGRLTPDVVAVGLTECAEHWLVTFFVASAISEDVEQDLVEVPGYAETFLEECVLGQIHASEAIRRPIRSAIVRDSPRLIQELMERVDRLLFAQSPCSA